jgi:TonB family protein
LIFVLLAVPGAISCASSAGRTVGDGPTSTAGSVIEITLDSAQVDSLRRAGVFLERVLDERPEILFGPQLRYPEQARQQCITGRVIIQAIIGRDGRAEAPSVRITQRVDFDLDRAALDYVRQASFKAGKIHGVAVRTLVNVPIDFKIRGRLC